jgi:hypothetical protein
MRPSFKSEIAPRLDAFSLKEIDNATGSSLAVCSRIRTGAKVPHPPHWETFRELAGRKGGRLIPALDKLVDFRKVHSST